MVQRKLSPIIRRLDDFEKRVIGTLFIVDGHIDIPEKYVLSDNKMRLVIRTPYVVRIDTHKKNGGMIASQQFFRQQGEKPYVPEGYIEIDGDVFKVVEAKK